MAGRHATWLIVVGSVLAAVGVLTGAFGAHGLADRAGAGALQTWDTAVRYQLVHALALVTVGVFSRRAGASSWAQIAGFGFVVGIGLFCGALYCLALDGPRVVARLAPVGGISFVIGWLALAMAALRED